MKPPAVLADGGFSLKKGGALMNNQTKKMTEGAMMVAIVGMLLFINRQLAGMLEWSCIGS